MTERIAMTEKEVEALRIDYESSLDPNHVIGARHGIVKSTVWNKARLGGWKRRPDYNHYKASRVVDPKILEHAKNLYEMGFTPTQIAPVVGRTRPTVERWRQVYGWQFIGPRMPPDKKPQEMEGDWPKVTAEWPEDARFDGMEVSRRELQIEDNDARIAFFEFRQKVGCTI
jgi:hypothetical protein